ncbi:hypothetical protein, partial [Enterobacter hormaechei]|uniref:hypothetical protein n=1 Tax=Enterobacter hormaechei TaxID=158836 RepID=UPI001ED99BA4
FISIFSTEKDFKKNFINSWLCPLIQITPSQNYLLQGMSLDWPYKHQRLPLGAVFLTTTA